ncbi:GMC family oxidoreductase [Paenibacillus daejeonensis]|uniref:GMC family oxidoreductase n=1 Tax=Paenibacillus daejeonensis TaxID=135193 RepID=UPI000365ED3A|nr:GMC family oxidoreductase [Paenibacillus daejeonensis]
METYFSESVRLSLEAIADTIVPADAWPSATESGALTVLARYAAEFPAVWQTLIGPGLRALDQEAMSTYGQPVSELSAEACHELLATIAPHDTRSAWTVSPKQFVESLTAIIIEGYYGTPEAGGNKGGEAWKMIGFLPGGPNGDYPPVRETDLQQAEWEQLQDTYDAVVVGAGAGGSVAAAELAEAGLRVLVVERGSWLRYDQIGADHLRNHRFTRYGHNTGPDLNGHPRTMLDAQGNERVSAPHEGDYHNNAMTVGGGTRIYGAQAWRFHPEDFRMASRYGVPEGSSLIDWPIRYEDLEPYYDRAEWKVGVSGEGNAHSGRGERERSYPMPALSQTREGSRLAAGAAKLGWHAGPVPLLINSVARDGRGACIRCGQCVGFACPSDSKNGGHNTMLVRALATGNCDLLCDTLVERIETEGGTTATGVRIVQEAGGQTRRRQIRAGHVVLAAGAIESARLLLNSATASEPDGIGNRSGQVGRHLQGHVYAGAYGLFEEPVQDGQGPGVSVATFRHEHAADSGIIGGGLLANEFTRLPILHWYRALAPDAPRWGLAGKTAMRKSYLHTSQIQGPIQEIPVADARVRLSQTVKDRYGLPVVQLSGGVHPESLRAAAYLAEQAEQWLLASGAYRVWRTKPGGALSGGQHQAGTLRMGHDPASSVTDPLGRVHGYRNLWVCDGSVHVTNGGVNPVLTILALAFRTSENLVKQG